jgi:hypothetical protein
MFLLRIFEYGARKFGSTFTRFLAGCAQGVNKFKTSIWSMQELIPINVVIGDRTYRIKIDPADEELVRKTLKTMNDKIIEYKTQFAGKDMQDYIAMVLLWYATQASSGDGLPGLNADVLESLTRMEQQLDKAL